MSADPKIEEICQKLADLTDAVDDLTEKLDAEIEGIKKQIDLAAQAAANAPNRTGTVLEKNQQMIWGKLAQIAAGITQLGAQIEEIKPDAATP